MKKFTTLLTKNRKYRKGYESIPMGFEITFKCGNCGINSHVNGGASCNDKEGTYHPSVQLMCQCGVTFSSRVFIDLNLKIKDGITIEDIE